MILEPVETDVESLKALVTLNNGKSSHVPISFKASGRSPVQIERCVRFYGRPPPSPLQNLSQVVFTYRTDLCLPRLVRRER